MLSAALLLQLVITHAEPMSPDNMVVRSNFSCHGIHDISFEYANDWRKGDRGAIRSVKIDGKEISGLARHLSDSAKNRSVRYLSVMKCGTTEDFLPISAEMVLSDSESTREKLPQIFFFRFDERGILDK